MRALGRALGLPDIFVGRHPFPGPGLAIRCPGEINREKLHILRLADDIYIEEIRRAGLYDVNRHPIGTPDRHPKGTPPSYVLSD